MSIATINYLIKIPETWRVDRGGERFLLSGSWIGRHGVCIAVSLHLRQGVVHYLMFLAARCVLYMSSWNAIRKNGWHSEGRRS